MTRNGILAGGNFIIDHVKVIDSWPSQDMLANILRETSANGGGPYNVLKDLSAMQAEFPLSAVGLVGADANGEWILADCKAAGIDTRQLQQTTAAPTSYTDAMTVASSGRRTFFHQRGANALLSQQHFDFTAVTAKWFHLGYLMLLDQMDQLSADGSTEAAQVLQRATSAGLITSLDLVSAEHPQFQQITEASLPHTDHLIINEIEAERATGIKTRYTAGQIQVDAVIAAAKTLLKQGVRHAVVIHFVEGAIAVESHGQVTQQASWKLPASGFIVGATGAGDAFAAGYLYAKHQQWPTQAALELAVTTAAACLTHATPSGGLRPIQQCRELVAGLAADDLALQARII
jgi:sugar/nucleoside kinase (ribokinase family)